MREWLKLFHSLSVRYEEMKISLTEEEYKALQDEVSLYTDLVPNIGEKKEGMLEFEFDPEDLDELVGYVAAAANHADTRKLEGILGVVCDKMETALKNQN